MKNIEIYCVTNKPIKFLETFNYQLCAVGKNNFSVFIKKPVYTRTKNLLENCNNIFWVLTTY